MRIETAARSLHPHDDIQEEALAFASSASGVPRTVCLVVRGLMGQRGGDIPACIVANTLRADFGGELGRSDHDLYVAAWVRGRAPDFPLWGTPPPGEAVSLEAELLRALRAASDALAAVSGGSVGILGAVLSCGVFEGTSLVVAHLGDSRVWRWRDGLSQLTEDHAFTAPGFSRPILLRAVGAPGPCEPDLQRVEVREGDVYLFGSPGLAQVADPRELASCVAASTSAAETADAIVAASGSADCSVSVVVARVGGGATV